MAISEDKHEKGEKFMRSLLLWHYVCKWREMFPSSKKNDNNNNNDNNNDNNNNNNVILVLTSSLDNGLYA